jgi:hypothetical protein
MFEGGCFFIMCDSGGIAYAVYISSESNSIHEPATPKNLIGVLCYHHAMFFIREKKTSPHLAFSKFLKKIFKEKFLYV